MGLAGRIGRRLLGRGGLGHRHRRARSGGAPRGARAGAPRNKRGGRGGPRHGFHRSPDAAAGSRGGARTAATGLPEQRPGGRRTGRLGCLSRTGTVGWPEAISGGSRHGRRSTGRDVSDLGPSGKPQRYGGRRSSHRTALTNVASKWACRIVVRREGRVSVLIYRNRRYGFSTILIAPSCFFWKISYPSGASWSGISWVLRSSTPRGSSSPVRSGKMSSTHCHTLACPMRS